ncbi:signal transduction histidine kinase [Desulfitispora alkaliphila]|uniref:sensor histidine kinase n=1 Tax=Desulfitispora alkaliphila TaxID=622674 RepID=UPI003D1DAACA
MKFGWKIFLLCMGIYVISLTATGFLVTENTYNSLLKREVERSLEEESNLHSTLALYLLNNKRIAKEKIELESYSKSMVDLVKTDRNYLEIYDHKLNLLATNSPKAWFFPREELEAALQGEKNFILRRDDDNGELYLFVANVLEVDQEKIVLSLIRDISHLDKHRYEQYMFFVKTGTIGLFFVALVSWGLSIVVMRPIKDLSLTAQNIASGNYHVRAKVTSSDEVGLLAEQFNTMAGEVEQRIGQLERQGQQQQRFIDNLTHELRTPLTSIIGYAEYLLAAQYDQKVFKRSLGYIHSEGKRMLKLSKALMDMILIRENAFDLEETDVSQLLWEVKEIMEVKAGERQIELKITGEHLSLPLDRDLFKGALLNLVDNALDASGPGQQIVLGVEREDDAASIFVVDQGKGMEESQLKRVTEPFYRVDKSRSRKEGGIGLGLAICHQIVAEHGAQMEISSKPGLGTRIDLTFEKRIYNSVTSSTQVG